MIEVYNINPFAEAMLYYSGRANNEHIKKRLSDAAKNYPAAKSLINRISEPIIELEKKLDSEIKADNRLIEKYFKRFDCPFPTSPFGFCLASVLAFYPVLSHIDSSPDEIYKFVECCSEEEKMYSLYFGIVNKYDTVSSDMDTADEFSKKLDKLLLPTDKKFVILNAAFAYHTHIEELLSLIKPAVKIIESSKDGYKRIIEEFYADYSPENALTMLRNNFLKTEINIKDLKTIKIAPMLFGFDMGFGNIESFDLSSDTAPDSIQSHSSDENSLCGNTGRIFIGVARHMVKRTSDSRVSDICEKMKALSDDIRMEMLFYLCGHRVYGQELCAKFGLTQSAVSYHVTKLFAAGLVNAEIVGSQTYYSADKEEIRKMLISFDERLKQAAQEDKK